MTTATHSPALDTAALLLEAQQLAPQVIDWRRALHRRPEVAFHEHETARFIRQVLEQIGDLEISRPTETSVMARLRTGRPGPVLAVRADIDALPIHEENDVEYRSQSDGAMHACGHDGHTSIALGLVTLLARHRDQLRGEVRFIFQHAEELSPGGAEEMVRQGVMDGVDQVIGLHVWSAMPVGRIGLIAGPAMAAPDTFECTIIGKGGHAAIPHGTIDPIAVGAQVVSALHAPAFLVDADPGRSRPAEGLALSRQFGHLLGRLDVAAEQDHAAQVELARQRSDLDRQGAIGNAPDQELADVASRG